MTVHAELATGQKRPLVCEAPIAIICNGTTLGVMMASPNDLKDFAIGFVASEGVLCDLSELQETEIIRHANGWEIQLWLTSAAETRVRNRQRMLVGPVGCGLCGIDSIDHAMRDLRRLPDGSATFKLADLLGAPLELRRHQPQHDLTRASHAAGFFVPGQGIVAVREDVGRHTALDKLAGALLLSGIDASRGAVVMTSRVSTEIVQKTATIGAPALVAVSAATDLARDLAAEANLTLVTCATRGNCNIEYCAGRIV